MDTALLSQVPQVVENGPQMLATAFPDGVRCQIPADLDEGRVYEAHGIPPLCGRELVSPLVGLSECLSQEWVSQDQHGLHPEGYASMVAQTPFWGRHIDLVG